MEGFAEPRGLAMSPSPRIASLLDHFSALKDPREAWRVIYPLPEIMLLVLCATLAGMADFVEIKLWGEQRIGFLRRFLPSERGIPSHDTLNDVMNALDPGLFKACFTASVEGLRETAPDIIAIDGKTSRRSHARAKGREPLHLVSAWACRQRLVPGQAAVGDKSNEIVAIPLLLERLALKANRPVLFGDVEAFFTDPQAGPLDTLVTTDADHGRIEVRRHAVCHHIDWAVRRPPLRRRAELPAPRHHRHGRNRSRAKRRDRAQQAILPLLRRTSTPRPSPAPGAPTGASKTASTGFSMWSSMTTSPACDPATDPKTWPSSNTWP